MVALEEILRWLPGEDYSDLKASNLISIADEVLEKDVASEFFDEFFRYSYAKSYTILINILDDVGVSEPLADQTHFFDAFARILDYYFDLMLTYDFNYHAHSSIKRVFHGIIHNVD